MKIYYKGKEYESTGATVMEAAGKLDDIELVFPCGGHGRCGKCAVFVCGEASEPTEEETKLLSAYNDAERDEMKKSAGAPDNAVFRLACLTAVGEDTVVYVPEYRMMSGAKAENLGSISLSPVVKIVPISLTLPTVAVPVDTESNIKTALGKAGEDNIRVPLSVAAKVTELISSASGVSVDVYAIIDTEDSSVLDVKKEKSDIYGLAVDIGTTTLAVSLWNLENGKRMAGSVCENPQRKHGADVISRMSFADVDDGAEVLKNEIRSALKKITDRLCADAGIAADSIYYVSIAGNSVMEYLFMGLPTGSIARSPFYLTSALGVSFRAADIIDMGGLFSAENAVIRLAPCAASYVGGDITAGLAYLTAHNRIDEGTLFIDMGTNGEMAVMADGKLYLAATAAGPALEGAHIRMGMSASAGAVYSVKKAEGCLEVTTVGDASPVGICGSGIISATAALLDCGIITEYGSIAEDEDEADEDYIEVYPDYAELVTETDDGKTAVNIAGDVVITDGDIRQIQTAKAAIYAGAKVLLEAAGIDKPSKIILAGSFGGGIDPTAAVRIGLLPETDGDVSSAGNTSEAGAALYMLDSAMRSALSKVSASYEYIELSTRPDFTEIFVDSMMF